MDFVSIDVETANADMASICQVGTALFANGELVEEWKTYVDPQDYFDEVNISIHGIDETMVVGAPTFRQLANNLNAILEYRVVVTHTYFDRTAIHQAASKNRILPPTCIWLDSARVARRAWSQFASSGYGLANVCKVLGYEFKHHDALEDAKAAGNIIVAAIEESGLDLDTWLKRVNEPITRASGALEKNMEIARQGNAEGPLHGEVLAFTGALQITRREAATLAAGAGCRVDQNVTRATTLLVVGDQDVKRLAGHAKSSKHRKAEELIMKGQSLRILRETDFQELVVSAGSKYEFD